MQKRLGFRTSIIPFPPAQLVPGSCQAERVYNTLNRKIVRMTMTREESDLKQLAYEVRRAKWRKEIGIVDMA
jgi:hypothetical protein